jgi:hypothetical protein
MLKTAKPIMSLSYVGLNQQPSYLKLPKFLSDELLRIIFFQELDDGQTYCAKNAHKLMDNDKENNCKIKFLMEIGEGKN